MPKIVDHQQRRRELTDALLRVAAQRGLGEVSLRHVAAEAGVTAGMVQHYFSTKDEMLDFAMTAVTERYTSRTMATVELLGPDPTPAAWVAALLHSLVPTGDQHADDARVAIGFRAHAATSPAAAERLGGDDAVLRDFVADQIRAAQDADDASSALEPVEVATALTALAEGLALLVISGGLLADAAVAALEGQLALVFNPPGADSPA